MMNLAIAVEFPDTQSQYRTIVKCRIAAFHSLEGIPRFIQINAPDFAPLFDKEESRRYHA
jgi:hypothetical protein